jgi:GAF domain-containing protein
MSHVSELVALTRELRGKKGLETLLQTVAEHAARLLDTPRASVRLIDPQRSRLLASARSGEPLHKNPVHEFSLGEGLVGWIALHAQPLRAGRAEEDPRFLPRPDMKEHMGSFVGVPILADLDCLGVLSAVHPTPEHFTEEHQDVLELLAALSAPYLEIARLARLSHLDPLTGAYNRNALEVLIEVRATLSVAMVDVDHFKDINDRHGHPTGDEVLRRRGALRRRGVPPGPARGLAGRGPSDRRARPRRRRDHPVRGGLLVGHDLARDRRAPPR